MDLTDEQWAVVEPLIPQPSKRADGKGRPRIDDRRILNGILWIMRTGAQWKDLPDRYPSYQTCHRRFQEWVRAGVFESLLQALARDLKDRGALDLTECFIDGTFVIAKKGAQGWEKPSGARVQRSWQWQTALVFLSPYPLAVLRRMR
jgi:transposase